MGLVGVIASPEQRSETAQILQQTIEENKKLAQDKHEIIFEDYNTDNPTYIRGRIAE